MKARANPWGRSIVRTLNGGDAMRLHVLADEFYDVVHRGAGLEDAGDAYLFQSFHILVGDNAADQHQHIVHLIFLEQVHHARNNRIVRARKNREADDLNVFLERGIDNHLRGLAEAGVDDFHAGIAKGAGNDLGATVVTVEARLGDQDADLLIRRGIGWINHREHLTTEYTGEHRGIADWRGQFAEVGCDLSSLAQNK